MRIKAEESILVVVDFQSRLVPAINRGMEVVEKSAKLIEGVRALGLPVLVTQQYTKGLGYSVPEIASAMGAESPETMDFIEKSSFSCFDCDEFQQKLKESGRKNVIICGIESHVCVCQTVVDLKEAGYQPVVITDCVSSRKEADYQNALMRYQGEGALISCFESILFELCRYSGSAEFKTISSLVK